MLNPLITLPEGAEGVAKFESLLHEPAKVFFVVLGESADHMKLVDAAKQQSHYWRHTILAKEPANLYGRLLSLPLRPGVLPIIAPWPPTIYAISISVNNYICRIVNTANIAEVAPAFILAETFMQP